MSLKTHTFSNGFRLIYEKPKSPIPLTSVYVFCDLGSAHEPDGLRGAAHLIEHMCFKGTNKIPRAEDLREEYNKIGAYFNAYTVHRYTCYTIKCQDEYLFNCTNILSDIMMNSLFKRSEFNKEHKVVIEENNNADNDPEQLLFIALYRLLYKGSSFAFPVDELAYHRPGALKHNELLALYHLCYRPHNMVMSIVSNIDFDKIMQMVKTTYFFKYKRDLLMDNCKTLTDKLSINYTVNPQTAIMYSLEHKAGVTNALITIGFRTCNRNSPDKYYLQLLRQIIKQDRLFNILREKKALVYTATVDTNYYEHAGDFIFFTKTNANTMIKSKNGRGVLPTLIDIINDLIKNGITEAELKNAKGSIKGVLLSKLETNERQTQYNGEEMLLQTCHDKIVPFEQLYTKFYADITRKNINDVIRRYFCRANMCVCILGEKIPAVDVVQKECEKMNEII
jgi:predicted Zn-dependent peptidase